MAELVLYGIRHHYGSSRPMRALPRHSSTNESGPGAITRYYSDCGVVGISLTMMDQISGPFQLELKDISLMVDHGNDGEEFAYEMYKIPHFWAGH